MIKVVELFAGAGGFRLGLEKEGGFEVVWGSEYDRDIFDCYSLHFTGKGILSNEDISTVDVHDIPNHDLLVGGFPCQGFSVAHSLNWEEEIQSRNGNLFWEIIRIIESKRPPFILLENIEALLKLHKGRDFSVILTTFRDLGYSVEWRVIDAADYGHAQKRKRIYLFAYRNDVPFAFKQVNETGQNILYNSGFFSMAFPVKDVLPTEQTTISFELPKDIIELSAYFSAKYDNAGIMREGKVYSSKIHPLSEDIIILNDILETDVEDRYYLSEQSIEKLLYLKGAKKIECVDRNGHKNIYSEGGMEFPESLKNPSRNIGTREGTINRNAHFVRDPETGYIRYLTPIECERLNGFPDNWTNKMPNNKRYFCMGNATAVGIVKRMGKRLNQINYTNNTEFKIPLQSKGKTSQSNKRRLLNIEFCKALPRDGLLFKKKERQIVLYTTKCNEKILIQYPGKESAKTTNEKPWDFRPKLIKPNGEYLHDLTFEEIWETLIQSFQKVPDRDRLLRLLALEFYKIAFIYNYELVGSNHFYQVMDYNITDEKLTRYYDLNIGKPLYLYHPNQYIINELSSFLPSVLGMSWEGFFIYNDLLAFNEDCKYFYGRETTKGDGGAYIGNGAGRINTLLTYINIIGFLLEETQLSKILSKLVNMRGVAPATNTLIQKILEDYLF